jgi:'Cold-shock' DNA-binding domain
VAPAIGRGAGGGSGATGAASLLIQIAGLPTLETKQLPGRSSVPIEKICTVRLSLYDDLIIVQVQHLEATLAKGTVKWFNQKKGYGFIQPVGGGRDVRSHHSRRARGSKHFE